MLIVGDFNFHFDCLTNSNTVHIMDTLQTFRFSQAASVPTHCYGHTFNLVVHWEEDSVLRSESVCHSLVIAVFWSSACDVFPGHFKTRVAPSATDNVESLCDRLSLAGAATSKKIVATKHVFCRNKHVFVATEHVFWVLSWQTDFLPWQISWQR